MNGSGGSRHAARFMKESCPFTNFNRQRLFNYQKTSFGLHTLLGVARVGLEWMGVGGNRWEHGLIKSIIYINTLSSRRIVVSD